MVEAPAPRKGMPDPGLDQTTIQKRFLEQYQDPAFAPLQYDLRRVARAARALQEGVQAKRAGLLACAGENLDSPRQK